MMLEKINESKNYRLDLDFDCISWALNKSAIIAITDDLGKIVYVNEEFCRISKYSENELIGQNHRILKSDYHPNSFYDSLWKTISNGYVWEGEIKNRAKDGSYYWVKTKIFPFLGSNGKIEKYVSIRIDITKQKVLEEKLTDSLQTIKESTKYLSLYEHSPVMYRTINYDGTILDCNDNYANRFGYTKSEIIGKSIFEFVAPESLEQIRISFKTWKNTGKVKNSIMWFMTKNYEFFPGLISATNLYDHAGRMIGSNSVISDLSDLHKAKTQIEDLKIQRLTVIGEMGSRLAHDILNPMSIIKNTSQLLQKKLEKYADSSINNYLVMISRSSDRILYQLNDVLQFLRSTPICITTNSLLEILHLAIGATRDSDKLEILIPKIDTTILCDKQKFIVIFVNLFTNAIQAMNAKGKIVVMVESDDDYHLIKIQDSGPGILDDDLPKIFEPLFTTKQQGTGLGLVSCKKIIEEHKGDIWVERNPTVFVIKIPKNLDMARKNPSTQNGSDKSC